MINKDKMKIRHMMLYLSAWLVYIIFSISTFPFFSISVMLFSIALAMLGAWLYSHYGALITIALSIPYHHYLLTLFSSDPAAMNETALNPFGISTQILASGAILLLRHSKIKLEELNKVLEKRVNDRMNELSHLQEYITQNHSTSEIMLSRLLLVDIGEALVRIKQKCDALVQQLESEHNPAAAKAGSLSDLVTNSISAVQNLEFSDQYYRDRSIEYASAIKRVMEHFKETAGVEFEVNIQPPPGEIPPQIQHQLYRISQEAITNAVRHAQTTFIEINLQADRESYRLEIINNGKGMPDKVESGLGLRLMKNRTEQLGGSLTLDRTADDRTRLSCTIPRACN